MASEERQAPTKKPTGKRNDPSNKRPQDKNRFLHPAETSCWQNEVKEWTFHYTERFRVVPPYRFEFGTSIKARWVGRLLLEVFSQEFPYFEDSLQYYTEAMELGRLRVNDEKASKDYRCRDGDVITHHVHRHEPPVTSEKIVIISDSDGILAVNKPSSIPIHPGGRYRRNSLLAILAKEHNMFDLHTVHRLDRLTSGLLLFGRSKAVAEMFRREFEDGNVQKQYLARVLGHVPPGTTLVDQPLACKNHREAIHEISSDGKPSQTRVTLLATGVGELEGQSLVLCEPLTGRTHQIRLHLQWLGCPIANDPLYGPAGVGSTSTAEQSADPPGEHEATCSVGEADSQDAVGKRDLDTALPRTNKKRRTELGIISEESARHDESLNLDANGWMDADCIHCRACRAEGCKGYYVPLKKKHDDSNAMLIWLHALTNKGATWSFRTPFPSWAEEFEEASQLLSKIDKLEQAK